MNDTGATEVLGRSWFTSQPLQSGVEAARTERGLRVDLTTYTSGAPDQLFDGDPELVLGVLLAGEDEEFVAGAAEAGRVVELLVVARLGRTGPVLRMTPARTAAGRRRLTDAESVLAVLGQGKGPLRAREVTVLLGLDDQNGAVDAVRTMLERLAKTGRAQRTGRGVYDALAG
ncbi:hypothetical protein ACWC9T_17180 [Kitasatospora sp. NPDC001159]